MNGFSGTVALEGNTLTLDGANETSAKFTGTNLIDANANQTLTADEALNGFSGTVELEGNTLTLDGANTTAAEFVGTGVINANANQTFTADNTDFVGTVNINTAGATLQLDGDLSQANKGTLNFNANNTTLRIWDEKTVEIGSKLVSNGVTGELIYNWYSDLTLSAEGALDAYDGEIRIAASANYPGKVTLKGDNVTDAFFTTVNYTTAAEVALDGGDLTLTNSDALIEYTGKVNVGNNTLTFDANGESATTALFYGDDDAVINIDSNTRLYGTTPGQVAASWYSGVGALDNFEGTINIADGKGLALQGKNTTDATFTGASNSTLTIANASSNGAAVTNTFNSEDAISEFDGKIVLDKNHLVLNADNTTSATVTGNSASSITTGANTKQEFAGNMSSFGGLFNIGTGAEVELSGDIATKINAQGNTLTLTNTTTKDITVNAGTGSDLDNLNFGGNNVALGAGDGDDFTNVIGEGNITDFGKDQEFGTVKAGTIFVTGSQDALTIENLTADINITVDAQQTDGKADVTINNNDFAGDISVKINDSEHLNTPYKVAFNGGFTTDTEISLTVESNAASSLKVDDRVIIDGETYLLQLKDNTLVLTKLPGYSNYVVVDGDWYGKDPYQSVDDNGTERIIGYNAAIDLNNAVEYIKGRPDGLDWGTATGDAMIELTDGKYQLTTGTLMTDANGVTQLTLQGRDGQTAILTGVIVGSDGSEATTLTLNNVSLQGNLYAGGNLVIDNETDLRTTGSVIAAGVADSDMAKDSKITINGGYFGNRLMVGGSVNNSSGKITVSGNTAVVIDNKYDEKLVISSNIVGGSWAATGDVEQTGDASILINLEKKTQIRGNIFVNGGEGNGTLTMSGDSVITFKGDGALLTFSGTVSAINGENTTEAITFDGFNGTFNGSMGGFDVITIKGASALELGRRQTKTKETDMTFVVNGDTTGAAMYTVRDPNNWEFDTVINVDASAAVAGEYILVDNYVGGFDGFTFTLNGQAYTLGNAAENSVIKVVDNKLVLSVYDSNTTNLVGNTTEQVVIDSTVADKPTQIVGNVVDNATTNNSAAVKVTTGGAVINNTGSITGADTQGSVAIQVDSGKTDVVVNNSGTITAADVAKYNRAIFSEAQDIAVSNSGEINGEIYQNYFMAKNLDVENSGTITALPTTNGGNSVVTASNGLITLSGDGGTYELAANTEINKFTGEIVEGQNGILVTADNTTFKAGTDVTVGTGSVKGLFNDNGMNIEIAGDGNTIQIVNKSSATGIEEFSYDLYKNNQSDVIISGDNTSISVTSASYATGIFERNGAIIISGQGTQIDVAANYAYGLEAKDVKNFSGDVVVGKFNADGSVAEASDLNLTVTGSTESIAVLANKGTAQIALSADGKIESNQTAISAESIQLTNAGTIIGDVKATGSATNDTITIDVDAVLNGSVSGVENLAVTGVSALATDVAGAKTIIGGVDDVLASASIDGVAADLNGTKVQIAGAATAETTDDVWASLTKNTDSSLTVAWGRSEAEVASALDAFKADSTLTLGDSIVASAATLDDGDAANDFSSKKDRGTLA